MAAPTDSSPVSSRPVYVDIQALQRPETAERGIGRFVIGLVRAMIDADVAVVGLGLNPELPHPDALPADLIASGLVCWTSRPEVRRRVGEHGFVHVVASPFGVSDVRHTAVFPPWLREPGVHSVAVVYDLIPFLFADAYAPTDEARSFLDDRRKEVVACDSLWAISDATRADAIAHWNVSPEAIRVIGAPRPREFAGDADAEEAPVVTEPYVLAPIGYEWRKDPAKLLAAWEQVPKARRRGRRLVLVGDAPEDVRRGWERAGSGFGGRRGEIVVLGRVGDGELRSLYRRAELVVHPSRYEGFGLPVLEASMCGAVSITADRGAAPEVLRTPESTFDPEDPASIAAAIDTALRDGRHRATIERAVTEAMAEPDPFSGLVVESLAATTDRERWIPPNQLVVVGGRERTSALEAAAIDRDRGPNVTHVPASAAAQLGRADIAAFDAAVYLLDDVPASSVEDLQPQEVEVLRLADEAPGVVVCRRRSLAPLWIDLARLRYPAAPVDHLHRLIERGYEGRHSPSLPSGELLDPATWDAAGVTGFASLAARSHALIVDDADLPAVRRDVGWDRGSFVQPRSSTDVASLALDRRKLGGDGSRRSS